MEFTFCNVDFQFPTSGTHNGRDENGLFYTAWSSRSSTEKLLAKGVEYQSLFDITGIDLNEPHIRDAILNAPLDDLEPNYHLRTHALASLTDIFKSEANAAEADDYIRYCKTLKMAAELNHQTGGLLIPGLVPENNFITSEKIPFIRDSVEAHFSHFAQLRESGMLEKYHAAIFEMKEIAIEDGTHEVFLQKYKNPDQQGFWASRGVAAPDVNQVNIAYFKHFQPTEDGRQFQDLNRELHLTPNAAIESSCQILEEKERQNPRNQHSRINSKTTGTFLPR